MVSNVNSLVTSTRVPMNLLEKELARVRARLCCGGRSNRRALATVSHHNNVRARVVLHWLKLMADARDATTRKSICGVVEPAATDLKLFKCSLNIASAAYVLTAAQKGELSRNNLSPAVQDALRAFQRCVKQYLHERSAARDVEFEAWYYRFRPERRALGWLSAGVLIVCSVFTLVVCLLLSGAFSETETLSWAEDVGKSIALQVFVTDPALGLLLVIFKLLINWRILHSARRRKRQQLANKQESVAADEMRTLRDIDVAKAKSAALKLVALADHDMVADEKRKQEGMKSECEMTLQNIAVTKLSIERKTAATPRNIDVDHCSAQLAMLDNEEIKTHRALTAIEAALEVLDGDHHDAGDELGEVQRALAKLQKKLDTIEHTKKCMVREREKLEDKPVIKQSAVMPVQRGVRARRADVDQVNEPDAQRVAMPSLRAASRHFPPQIAGAYADSTSPSRAERHKTRRTRTRSQALRVQRKKTAALNLRVAPGGHKASLVPRRKMTWTEVQALQKKLKAEAASDTAAPVRRTSTTRMSRKAIKIVLERRARRQKLLAQRARDKERTENGLSENRDVLL